MPSRRLYLSGAAKVTNSKVTAKCHEGARDVVTVPVTMHVSVDPTPFISLTKESHIIDSLMSESRQRKLHFEVVPEVNFDASKSTQTLQLDDTLGDIAMNISTQTQSLEDTIYDILMDMSTQTLDDELAGLVMDRSTQSLLEFKPLENIPATTPTPTQLEEREAFIRQTFHKSIQTKLLEEPFPGLAVDTSTQTGMLSDLSLTSSTPTQLLMEIFPDLSITSSTPTLLLNDTLQDYVLCQSTQTQLFDYNLPELAMDKAMQTQSMVEVLESIIYTSVKYTSSEMELKQSEKVESSETLSLPEVDRGTQASLLTKLVNTGAQVSLLTRLVNIGTQTSLLTEEVNIGTQTSLLTEQVNIDTQTSLLTEEVNIGTQTSCLLSEKVNTSIQTFLLTENVNIEIQTSLFTEEVGVDPPTPPLSTEKVNVSESCSQKKVGLSTLMITTPSPSLKKDPTSDIMSPQLLIPSSNSEAHFTSSPDNSNTQKTCLLSNSEKMPLGSMAKEENIDTYAVNMEAASLALASHEKKEPPPQPSPTSQRSETREAIRPPTQKSRSKSSTVSHPKEDRAGATNVGATNVDAASLTASLQLKGRPSSLPSKSYTHALEVHGFLPLSTQQTQPTNLSPFQHDGIEITSAHFDAPTPVFPMHRLRASPSQLPSRRKKVAQRVLPASKKRRLKGPPRLSPFPPPPCPPTPPSLARPRLPAPKAPRNVPTIFVPPSPPPPPKKNSPPRSPTRL